MLIAENRKTFDELFVAFLLPTSDTLDARHQTQTTGNTNDSFCIIYTSLCSVFHLRLSTMRSTLGVFSLAIFFLFVF